jgi:Na+/H+ antiporter NhaD/arsenite permease-like protein
MIGSAANISFLQFFDHMGVTVFVAWIAILYTLKFLFKKELSVVPAERDFVEQEQIIDPRTWYAALGILGAMTILFVLHHTLHWDAWFVAALGLTALIFIAGQVELDEYSSRMELSLLMFFISLFILVGGVERSHFLGYLGQFILPFVQIDLLVACLVLMWASAIFSSVIDNIPFTAAMIPIIMGLETQGVNVTPLWWALAIGVGMGGNGTYLGSTANVFIVTISERMAKESGDRSNVITPGLWFRKGTPAMIVTLITSSIIMWVFWDFYSNPLHP